MSQSTGSRSRYLLGTEGCGHTGIVGGLYILLRVPQAVETLLYHPFSTHSFRSPPYLGRNLSPVPPQQGAHGWEIGQPLCLLWRVLLISSPPEL